MIHTYRWYHSGYESNHFVYNKNVNVIRFLQGGNTIIVEKRNNA